MWIGVKTPTTKHMAATFSSTIGVLLRDDSAALSLRPRSARTMLSGDEEVQRALGVTDQPARLSCIVYRFTEFVDNLSCHYKHVMSSVLLMVW